MSPSQLPSSQKDKKCLLLQLLGEREKERGRGCSRNVRRGTLEKNKIFRTVLCLPFQKSVILSKLSTISPAAAFVSLSLQRCEGWDLGEKAVSLGAQRTSKELSIQIRVPRKGRKDNSRAAAAAAATTTNLARAFCVSLRAVPIQIGIGAGMEKEAAAFGN